MAARGRSEQLRAADVWRQLDVKMETERSWEEPGSQDYPHIPPSVVPRKHLPHLHLKNPGAGAPIMTPHTEEETSAHGSALSGGNANSFEWSQRSKHTVWCSHTHALLKCPIMGNERFIFWFLGVNPTTGWHACTVKKQTLSLSYNMHYFYLTCSMTPKRFAHCVTLICTDWSNFHLISPVMPDKAVFVSAVLLCVQRYRGNRYFLRSKSAT